MTCVVEVEMRRFDAALPELLKEYRERWVVFRDGQVVSVFDAEEDAYQDGLRRFGRHGGHVVASVVERRVVHVPSISVTTKPSSPSRTS
jgi:hypothetical protein